jgi:flavin reductase (DIM6/NTAB) family NADH-FMN oxidoreductase RutF
MSDSDKTRPSFDLIATNVAVITVADDRGIHGCTANAWAEDHEPPLLLVTLRNDSETRDRIVRRGCFAVNVLAADQRSLATRFAGNRDRFAGVEHRCGALGQPLLADALVAFECTTVSTHPFGTMEILVGRVEDTKVREDAGPLLFFSRRFHAGPGPHAA